MKDTKDMSVREIIALIIGDEFMNEPECRDALLDILERYEALEKELKSYKDNYDR